MWCPTYVCYPSRGGNRKRMARMGPPLRASNEGFPKPRVARAQGTHSGHPRDNIYEQAWRNYFLLLPAALLGCHFEQPVGMLSPCVTSTL
jgi:hypothetical protein